MCYAVGNSLLWKGAKTTAKCELPRDVKKSKKALDLTTGGNPNDIAHGPIIEAFTALDTSLEERLGGSFHKITYQWFP